MTEAEWLLSTETQLMLDFLREKQSDRKFRLYQVACCRRIWDLMPNDVCREAVFVAERQADGNLAKGEWGDVRKRMDQQPMFRSVVGLLAQEAAQRATDSMIRGKSIRLGTATVRLLTFPPLSIQPASIGETREYADASRIEPAAEVQLLRDIFGNPFRPVTFDPAWRTATALSLASQMYDSRDFSAMPILADALQDAGCDNEDLLNHCRDASATHVRGCWVVDLVLGKA